MTLPQKLYTYIYFPYNHSYFFLYYIIVYYSTLLYTIFILFEVILIFILLTNLLSVFLPECLYILLHGSSGYDCRNIYIFFPQKGKEM